MKVLLCQSEEDAGSNVGVEADIVESDPPPDVVIGFDQQVYSLLTYGGEEGDGPVAIYQKATSAVAVKA